MLKKTIYLVRHGETILNAAHIRQGEAGGLSPKGKEQAFATGKRLANFKIEKIFCSTFQRAMETGDEILKSVPAPIEYTPLLGERRNPSSIIGKSYNETITVNAINFMDRSYHDPNAHIEDEENFNELRDRALRLRDFLAKNAKTHTLCITHGIFLKMFLCVLIYGEKLTVEDYIKLTLFNPADNAGITVVEYDRIAFFSNPWKIIAYNDGPVSSGSLKI